MCLERFANPSIGVEFADGYTLHDGLVDASGIWDACGKDEVGTIHVGSSLLEDLCRLGPPIELGEEIAQDGRLILDFTVNRADGPD